jgi:hypothetical protein
MHRDGSTGQLLFARLASQFWAGEIPPPALTELGGVQFALNLTTGSVIEPLYRCPRLLSIRRRNMVRDGAMALIYEQ